MSIIYTKEQLIQYLKDYIDKNGLPKNIRNDFKRKNGLPSSRTYRRLFGNGLDKWIEQTGYILNKEELAEIKKRAASKIDYTKEEVIHRILKMQSKLNRPLMYDDFRNPQSEEVGIRYVNKYFGTMNKMKEELGLEIIQESMIDLHISKEEFIKHINEITEMFYKETNSKILTTDYFNELKNYRNYETYWNLCKKYFDMQLRDYLNIIGFDLIKCGQGHSFYFDDGEIATSKHEKIFSNYLRNKLCLKYNHDYFRNIKYRSFVNSYTGLMNCDYIINIDNKEIYIEIVGFLRDYKNYYLNNIPIKQKDKETYRLKLLEKIQMLESKKLNYYILFPDDLNEITLNHLFYSI